MFTPDQKLMAAIDRLSAEVFELAIWLTDHPEVSEKEKESSAAVIAFLKERGYSLQAPYGGVDYSFRAVPPGTDPTHPRVAILCEYDALPEIGHACGHSLSCGISILTALALREAAPDLPLTFELIGTPAEETIGGKAIMVENGAFDRYALALMSHLDWVNAPQNKALACSDMHITFHGKSAHSSFRPWDGVNAFNAAQLFVHASDMMRQHIKPDWQFHGIITKGGAAPNIVPELVELDYYLRAATTTGLEELRQILINCIKGAAIATGCTYELERRESIFGDLFPAKSAEPIMTEIYTAFGFDYHIYEEYNGSTDLGNVDFVTPTLAISTKATDHYIPIHTLEFQQQLYGQRGLKTLLEGTRVQASLLMELGRHPEKLAAIQAEHRAYRQGRTLEPTDG